MILSILSAAPLLGLFFGSQTSVPLLLGALLACLALAYLPLSRGRRWETVAAICLALFLAGLIRQQLHQSRLSADPLLAYGEGATMALKGYVAEEPLERSSYSRWLLEVAQVDDGRGWHSLPSKVLVYSQRLPPYEYGDALVIKGRLEEPPELSGFDYRGYLEKRGVHYVISFPSVLERSEKVFTPYSLISAVRNRIADTLEKLLPEPQASLSQGMLLGLRGKISREVLDAFARTGTTHILAISGQNFSIVTGLLVLLSAKTLGRRRPTSLVLIMLAIWLYAALTGAPPSVVRAALMGSLAMLAFFAGRQPNFSGALLSSAAVMGFSDPGILWDMGFQLSFFAMAGVLFVTPLLIALTSDRLERLSVIGPAPRAMLSGGLVALFAGVGAWLTTTPVILSNFGSVPLASIPATILILPSFVPIIGASAIAGVLGTVLPWLAHPFAWLAWLSASYMLLVVKLWDSLPVASLRLGWAPPWQLWLIYYPLLFTAIWGTRRLLAGRGLGLLPLSFPIGQPLVELRRLSGRSLAYFSLAGVALLAGSLALAWNLSYGRPALEVIFFDVGQGDAALVKTASGRKVLIDGGPNPDVLMERLGDSLPFWDRRIDLVVLSHPQHDHLAGLVEVANRYSIGGVIEGGARRQSKEYAEWQRALEKSRAPVTIAKAGAVIYLDRETAIEVLHPRAGSPLESSDNINNLSMVLRLTTATASFLFPGDIEALAERELLQNGYSIQSSVIKVPHHGSSTSSTQQFLERVAAEVAVISVGRDNSFGHPSKEVLQRLEAVEVFRTDQHGSIRIKVREWNLSVGADTASR